MIGGGVCGLSAAVAIEESSHEAVLFEASDRVGGLVHTERTAGGLLLEHGPDAVLASKPAAMPAFRAFGLEEQVVNPKSGAFVLRGGDLHPLPAGLLAMGPGVGWQMLRSPLFSVAGKARFLLEPFVPARRTDDDESVASFFTRRFGAEVADRLVDPLFGGIYGSATSELSMRSVMPHLPKSEREHGSITGSLIRTLTKPKKRSSSPTPARRGPPLVGLRDGMGSLCDRMAERLGERIHTNAAVRSVRPESDGYRLALEEGSAPRFDAVIVATPAWHTAAIVETLDPDVAAQLGEITASGVDSVTLSFARADCPRALTGTGFVVPRSESRPAQGVHVGEREVAGTRAGRSPRAPRVPLRLRADRGSRSRRDRAERNPRRARHPRRPGLQTRLPQTKSAAPLRPRSPRPRRVDPSAARRTPGHRARGKRVRRDRRPRLHPQRTVRRARRSHPGRRVNFFGHAYTAMWFDTSPRWVLGAMLPDFASMSGTRLLGAGDDRVAGGIEHHHMTDAVFHRCEIFLDQEHDGTKRLQEVGLWRGSAMAVAHVGTELILDGLLLDEPGLRETAIDAMTVATDPALQLEWSAGGAEKFARLCARLEQVEDLGVEYRDSARLAKRLYLILRRRPRLAFEEHAIDAIIPWLDATRAALVLERDTLLDDVRRGLDERRVVG